MGRPKKETPPLLEEVAAAEPELAAEPKRTITSADIQATRDKQNEAAALIRKKRFEAANRF